MSDSEDTLKKVILEQILEAVNQVNTRLDKLEETTKSHSIQLEAIREGIVHNSAAMDRLQSAFHANRSDIYELRAEIKEMSEEIRQNKLALK